MAEDTRWHAEVVANWNVVRRTQEMMHQRTAGQRLKPRFGAEDMTKALVLKDALQLVKDCNVFALGVLYGPNGAPWTAVHLDTHPSEQRVEEAAKFLKVADIALASPQLQEMREMVLRRPTQHGPAIRGIDTHLNVHERFACAWPFILTAANHGIVARCGRKLRLAMMHCDASLRYLSEVGASPESLIHVACTATGSFAIAAQVAIVISSQSCILHENGRISQALPIAELAISLARSLHHRTFAQATKDLADARAQEAAVRLMQTEEGRSSVLTEWPSLLQGRSACPMLIALVLYNGAVIFAGAGHLKRCNLFTPLEMLREAISFATAELGESHRFVRMLAEKHFALQQGDDDKRYSHTLMRRIEAARAVGNGPERVLRRLRAQNPLQELNAAHGAISNHAAFRRRPNSALASRGPIRVLRCGEEDSWMSDIAGM